jgi:hypothetical protein
MLKRAKPFLFGFLTFTNLGLTALFYYLGLNEYSLLSGATTLLCTFVWIIDVKVGLNDVS